MKEFPTSPDMLRAARRIIWFKAPEESLRNPVELMAYAMKHATDEDMALLLSYCGLEGLKEAIDNAPPGIVDGRSWAYWNLRVGRYPAPERPVRRFEVER
jgi:hypothetical protein